MRLLHDVEFTIADIEEHLSNLNTAQSAGPDGLHPRILKELASPLAKPLYIIFRKEDCPYQPHIQERYTQQARKLSSSEPYRYSMQDIR